AVALAPTGSRDVWSYAAYGREVAIYHESPYVHRPAEHPADPIVERVSPGWRHTRSVYGPVFVGLASAIALATSNPLILRLTFQFLAAAALLASLFMIW